ncbi:MAG: 23S rRNA (guanine(745)-N(1))-methyltransferase [Spirochaetaceae bacterium]|nr:23S rRNA (guanine(745)-N(1))-methyltransferase [Spirochaetaceae bacterium]
MKNFICPHCKSSLRLQNRSLICENRHCFDLAKEGYVNLLPVNWKKTKDPGDNSKMMMARRAFLESGHYEPLADKLAEIIKKIHENERATLLDLGCGEGYYAAYIKEQNRAINMLGLDISKTAIRYASKKYKDISFSVASAFQIPISDNELDIVLRIYAPSSDSELQRVIKKGGYLITVTPGERHLYQLRDIIYREVRKHREEAKELKLFQLEEKIKLTYSLDIQDLPTIQNLLEMTPFGWKISEEDKDGLYKMGQWHIDCDFNIEVYKRDD